jgi:hypothetical protein
MRDSYQSAFVDAASALMGTLIDPDFNDSFPELAFSGC